MPKIKDRTGEKYGRLIVIKRADTSNARKGVRWLCKCDCGNEKIIFSDELSSGKSNSCGCLKSEHLNNIGFQFRGNKNRQEQIMKDLYKGSRFKKKGIDISFDEFCKLSFSKCYYCGLEYSKRIIDRMKSDEYVNINGIDRIDSNIGYLNSNTVACCKICNIAKSTLTKDEFFTRINRVYNYNLKNIQQQL